MDNEEHAFLTVTGNWLYVFKLYTCGFFSHVRVAFALCG